MRRCIMITFFLLMMYSPSDAQHVGIGTATPTQPLDVNGNVNINGGLMANGDAGKPGDVLLSTGAGLTWGSLAGYKYCKMIYTPGGGSWVVPDSVKEIMVEAWGAGGGYGDRLGGTSGSYARLVQAVTPGSSIPYTIGAGAGLNGAGGNTTVQVPGGNLVAPGGGAITYTSNRTVYGPNIMALPGSRDAYYVPGNRGTPDSYTYGQKSATIYTQTSVLGMGGAPVGFLHASPNPGNYIYYENGVITFVITNTVATAVPSAGGVYYFNGGPGMIVFWWK